jgi:hypothetical protein
MMTSRPMIHPLPEPPLSASLAPLPDAALVGSGVNGAPHEPQNVDPTIAWVPHFEQNTRGGAVGGVDSDAAAGGVGSGSGVGEGDP